MRVSLVSWHGATHERGYIMAVAKGEWGKNQRMRATWTAGSKIIHMAFRYIPDTRDYDTSRYPAEMREMAAMTGFCQTKFADTNALDNDGKLSDAEKCRKVLERCDRIDAALAAGSWYAGRGPTGPAINTASVINAFAEVFSIDANEAFARFAKVAEADGKTIDAVAQEAVVIPEIATVYARIEADKKADETKGQANLTLSKLLGKPTEPVDEPEVE